MKLSIHSGFAIAAALAFSVAGIGCSKNQTSSTAADRPGEYGDRSSANLTADERDFAVKALQGGLAEVEMGKLALERGDAQLKEFGRKLVDDHTKINNDLRDVAAKEGIVLPSDVSGKQRETIDKLSKTPSSDFAKDFLKESVDDHRKDVDEFQKEAGSGHDQALKNFAASNALIIQDHLNTAQNLSKSTAK